VCLQDAFYAYLDEAPEWGEEAVSLSQHAYEKWASLASQVPSFNGAYQPAKGAEIAGYPNPHQTTPTNGTAWPTPGKKQTRDFLKRHAALYLPETGAPLMETGPKATELLMELQGQRDAPLLSPGSPLGWRHGDRPGMMRKSKASAHTKAI
jgi:hypothetical protein